MIPVPVEIMPKPELTKPQRRFFAVVNKKNAIGFWLISLGSAFCLGYLLTDRAHLHEKIVLAIGEGCAALHGSKVRYRRNQGEPVSAAAFL